MSLTIKDKQLLLDGIPQTLMFAEFHYYRTKRSEWEDRIKQIVDAGFQGIASYIPWLLHEYHEKDFDFTGKYHEAHDLIGFIELVESYGLYFIPRPGPFIMAEMKNDGIPFWVSQKYPDVKPITWHHHEGTTVTVDYMNEHFLKASKSYYEQVIPILVDHMYPKGKIIALQLDNEVGMLSWVSNNPELNDPVIKSFTDFIKTSYQNPLELYPFINNSFDEIKHKIRVPETSYLNQLHFDLGHFFRTRLASYITYLKNISIDLGFNQNLFIINIHGCSAGRSTTYPIGLSQLYEAYTNQKDMISGSDLYINDFDVPTFQDSYMANILTDALNDEDQVLTSLEFSAGTGDYGDNYSQRYSTSRIDLMTRSFVALGNRLLNFYTFAGGTNYRLNDHLGDGNDRIATTGERHGFAAPIDPEGNKSYVFDKTKEVVTLMKYHQFHLAKQKPVFDDITYGFIPDYFMTEFHYPDVSPTIHQNISKYRGGMFWDVISKSLLLLNYHFDATDLQRFNPDPNKLLLLPSATYMEAFIQQKIVDFLKQDGRLLLYGELPRFDLKGNDCSILSDYLELEFIQNEIHKPHPYRSSIISKHILEGKKELHRPFWQTWKTSDPKNVLLSVYGINEDCGFIFDKPYKKAIIITSEFHSDLEAFEKFMRFFNVNKHIHTSTISYHGVFVFQSQNEELESYMHIINLDDFNKTFEVLLQGKPRLIELESRQALMLPMNLKLNSDIKILYTTNEIDAFDDNHLSIKLAGKSFNLQLETKKLVTCDDPFVKIKVKDSIVEIVRTNRLFDESHITIKIK